ncbi:recombinase family protein [Skermania sp. ID1734]|uniref:recombinase family protein n=1 Tax=Skermania sp. ID1734 TaxID=2597516 RepID=UPI00117EB6B1|nr:recombinase family protein [Skermania sp. ID1734]TSD95039.1 recombinase family protein [Skermania sp. ID1734]
MRAAIYLRQSLDRYGDGLAVTRQREDCVKLAHQKGWTPVEYIDNDVSASKGKRPAYERMLTDIAAGKVNAVVCWDLDRLHRQPIELEHFMALADKHNLLLATVTGDVDLSTDNGRMFARIKGAVARAEVERKGKRQTRAAQQRAELGKPLWPCRVFGYTDDLALHPVESAMVRDAYRAFLSGSSLGSIAREWNDKGVPSTRGNKWSANTVGVLLKKPRNAGLREYRGEVVGKGNWPAIVDEDTWRAARAVFDTPGRRFAPAPGRRHLLTGLARCGVCGQGLKAQITRARNGSRYPIYCCTGCFKVSRRMGRVDDVVIAMVCGRLARADAVELLHDTDRPDVEQLRADANGIRARMDGLAAAYADDDIMTPAQFRIANERLAERLKAVESLLIAAAKAHLYDGLPLGSDSVRKKFEGLDLDRQRALIDALMTVTVLPTVRGQKVFDESKVVIEWRAQGVAAA